MNPYSVCDELVRQAVNSLASSRGIEIDLVRVVVEPSRHGNIDVQTNAAMVLAKDFRLPPLKLAGLIASELMKQPKTMNKG